MKTNKTCGINCTILKFIDWITDIIKRKKEYKS